MLRYPREVEKALYVTLIIWFFFFSECHLTLGPALSLQNRTSSAMHTAWSVLHTTNIGEVNYGGFLNTLIVK